MNEEQTQETQEETAPAEEGEAKEETPTDEGKAKEETEGAE